MMLIFFNEDRRIHSYYGAHKEDAEQIMQQNPLCAWYEGEFSFSMDEGKSGFEKVFYLDEDGAIRIEYEPEPALPLPLFEQEQIAIDTALNVEYIACLMEANLQ